MNKNIEMNPNLLVRFLGKPASEFTCEDVIRYCRENAVQFINLHYCGWDGKLKTLNFVINSAEHLESILQAGERVDDHASNRGMPSVHPYPVRSNLHRAGVSRYAATHP